MYHGFPVALVLLLGVVATAVLVGAELKKTTLPTWLMVGLMMVVGVCFASAILAMCL